MSLRSVSNKALPVHHTATVEGAWDGPAAVAAMPNQASVLQYCHAWQNSASVDADTDDYDNDADDKKANYKFPHHKEKGGPAFLAGVRNALARLEGSSIPESDKDGVRRHLEAHLQDAHQDEPDNQARLHLASGRPRMFRGTVPGGRGLRVVNATDRQATIYLFDEISWFGITADEFSAQLRQVDATDIVLNVNSPGGDVFDGLAIYNELKAHPATVTARIQGLAASAASFIVMAADRIEIARNAQMMIHNAQGVCIGDADAMDRSATFLRAQTDNIADIYHQRAGGTRNDWLARMGEESWYTGQQAVDIGLADTVTSEGAANQWQLQPAAKNPRRAAAVHRNEFSDLPEGYFLEAFRAFGQGGSQ